MIFFVDLHGECNVCMASTHFDNNKDTASNFRKFDIQMQGSDVSFLSLLIIQYFPHKWITLQFGQ